MEGKLQIVVEFIYSLVNAFILSLGNIAFRNKIKTCRNNKAFKDRLCGQRCFVLGNGPSLNSQDLSLLEGETVFTVNQFLRNDQHTCFKSSFHFWMDNNFFSYDSHRPEDRELLDVMINTANQENIECFYPYNQRSYLMTNGINTDNAHYLLPILKMHNKYNRNPRIDKFVPGFGTVVLYAVYTAVYMGASEIYLLGCDETGIEATIASVLKRENNNYSYSVTDSEKLRMEKMVERSGMLQYAYSYYRTLKGFEEMLQYCTKRNVKLVNLSAQSVLDMIPSDSLERIVNKKND